MPGFLSSNLYYKYLSDLINSVRVDEFTGGNANTTPEVDRNLSVTEGSQAQVIDWFDGHQKLKLHLFFIIIQGFFKNMVACMANFVLIFNCSKVLKKRQSRS